AATTWLYQNRRDRDGGLRGSRIAATIRSTSNHVASPRTARITAGAASADSGASGGASRESYMIPDTRDVPASPASHASRALCATESSDGSYAFVMEIARAAPSEDFVALRSMTASISWPSLFASQWWVSLRTTNVARAPSNARGLEVTASIRARP